MAINVTLSWFSRASQGSIGAAPWGTNTMKVALLNAVPDQDTPEFWNDISATEVTGTNWSAGGVALANKTNSFDAANNRTYLNADDVSVASVTVAGVEAIAVYDDTGVPSTSRLWGFGDLASTGASSGGDLTITWDANGLLSLSAS